MPAVTVELNANDAIQDEPICWRLGNLFNVVTNIRRARVTDDYGYVALNLEGTTDEVNQAIAYLRALGLLPNRGTAITPPPPPEADIPQPNAISLRLTTVTPSHHSMPFLYRVGKDFGAVVNINRAEFDEEEGGYVEITLSGPLIEVQRAITYLHTTGLHVNPFQRSVSDQGNL